MAIYIYTLPKAGTYFFSHLVTQLGFNDTGYHVEANCYLDTKAHPVEVNARTPGIARVDRFFVPLIRSLGLKDVAAGHFPLPMNFDVFGDRMQYLCAYRDPRRTLVSEFIDFRFRRTGIKWILPEAIADDREAFCTFLRRNGFGAHLNIFREFVLHRAIIQSPLCSEDRKRRSIFVNFDRALVAPEETVRLAKFLGIDITLERAIELLRATHAADTKTKATSIVFDRDAMWSDEANQLYAESDFPTVFEMARDLGLEF